MDSVGLDENEVVLGAQVKALVTEGQKAALESIAKRRQLATADIVREAVRFYLQHHTEKLEAA